MSGLFYPWPGIRMPQTLPKTDADLQAGLATSGRRVIEIEARALDALAERIDGTFSAACQLILSSKGRVVATGMGKSGHIARKIAATLASTGTPAFYVHPGEAGHGDLGMITDADVVLALSYSGESDEVLMLLPALKAPSMRAPIAARPSASIAITRRPAAAKSNPASSAGGAAGMFAVGGAIGAAGVPLDLSA